MFAMIEDEGQCIGGKLDFLAHFSGLSGPRQALKVLYPLNEVLLLTLCPVLCGADGWVSVALFGRQNFAFLQWFLPIANGTPSHDQLGLIFLGTGCDGLSCLFHLLSACLKQTV